MRVMITDEMKDIAQEMYDNGSSYQDIVQYFYEHNGVFIHVDTIRYIVKRRHIKKVSLVEKLKEENIEKMLVLSDLHIPYQRDDVLEIVEKHKDEISTLVLNGDIIDCYAISSFPKLEPKPLVTEMSECHKVLKQIQDLLPNVKKIITIGNHEKRFEKYLGENTSEVNKLHSSNIIREITRGFEFHDRQLGIVTHYEKLDYEVVDNWFCQVNDCICCHPTSFSRVSAKTAQMALDYFVEGGSDFSVCLTAHTHKIGSCFKYGKYAVETGCLCKPQGYASSGRLTYTQQQCGYHLATFVNGKYDVNQSRQYILE